VPPQHEGGNGKNKSLASKSKWVWFAVGNPPWVYKPMPIFWVIKLCQDYLAKNNIITSCCDCFCHCNLNVHHHCQKNFSSHCQERITGTKA
jgi:hypothetical protein